jgi:uncharacterized protein YidB (DUF937 family)
MGILEDVLGSVLGGQQRGGGTLGGGMQGGLPGGLGGMLGGGSQGGMSPIMMALMALLTQQMSSRSSSGSSGGGMGGGLGDLLGGFTGQGGMGQVTGSGQVRQPDRSESYEEPTEGSLGSRGEFSGGHTGFDGLLERLERGGQGQKAQSWVSHGRNELIAPEELQSVLGNDTVDQLVTQTGMSKGDLLSQLSELLPGVVDKLTPNGRRPTLEETQNW